MELAVKNQGLRLYDKTTMIKLLFYSYCGDKIIGHLVNKNIFCFTW